MIIDHSEATERTKGLLCLAVQGQPVLHGKDIKAQEPDSAAHTAFTVGKQGDEHRSVFAVSQFKQLRIPYAGNGPAHC